MVNKVRIEIAGSRYVIATPEGEERVLSLGREIDAQVRQLMDGNDRVTSTSTGAVLSQLCQCL